MSSVARATLHGIAGASLRDWILGHAEVSYLRMEGRDPFQTIMLDKTLFLP